MTRSSNILFLISFAAMITFAMNGRTQAATGTSGNDVTAPTIRYAKVLIRNNAKDVERRLRLGGYDLLGMTADGNFEAVANDYDRTRLSNEGFSWEETIHDITAYYVQRFHDSPTDLIAGYPTFAETIDSMNLYATQRPDLVAQPVIIGRSVQNRNIYAIKVTHNPNDTITRKPEVFYNGLIHAREMISHTQLLYYIRYLINNYNTNTRVQNILNNRTLWFVPVVNPDGVVYNETQNPNGGGMWRKNRRRNSDNSYGIDLNRNFGSHWGYDNLGSSSTPNSDTYRGTAAFSEPESQVLRDFQIAHNFRITLDYHSYSNDVIVPMSYRREWAPDHQVFYKIEHIFGDPVGYVVGNVWWLLYPANGDGAEWQYITSPDTMRNFSFVSEVGTATDQFWPTQTRIIPLCQQTLEMNLRAAELAGEPRIVLPPPIPRITCPDTVSAHTPVTWTIDTPSTINPAVNYDFRAAPVYRIGTETFDTTTTLNWTMSYVSQGREYPSTNWIEGTHAFSGMVAAKFQNTNSVIDILKSVYPIKIEATDTLNYRIWYNTETNFDYVFTQISTDDGVSWYSLAGNITTATNPNYANWDYGITGTSNSFFTLAKFPLAQYAGRSALFRILYWTDGMTLCTGVWVDNITPSVLTSSPWTTHRDTLASTSYSLGIGQWFVQVRARDAQGDTSAWSVPKRVTVVANTAQEPKTIVIPFRFALNGAYPNPFNPSTTIRYSLDREENILLAVYSIEGRKVATLTTGTQRTGEYQIRWSGRDDFGVQVATGLYFVKLQTATRAVTMKVVLVQ